MKVPVSNLRIINQKANKEVAIVNAEMEIVVHERIAISVTLRGKMARSRTLNKCKTLKEVLVLKDFQEACSRKQKYLFKVRKGLVNLDPLAKILPKVLVLGSTIVQLNINNPNSRLPRNINSNSNISHNNPNLTANLSNTLTAMRSIKEVIFADSSKMVVVIWFTANKNTFSVE